MYNDYKSKFESQKEVKAKHILVDSEAKAKEVIAKLKKGEDFVKLANEYSKDQVELGYFTEDMMVPEFSKAAFSMDKGEFSKTPVKTEFGYHVILVEDVRASKPLELKEIEPQLKNMVTQQVIAKILKICAITPRLKSLLWTGILFLKRSKLGFSLEKSPFQGALLFC